MRYTYCMYCVHLILHVQCEVWMTKATDLVVTFTIKKPCERNLLPAAGSKITSMNECIIGSRNLRPLTIHSGACEYVQEIIVQDSWTAPTG